jgi:hypothetical protein
MAESHCLRGGNEWPTRHCANDMERSIGKKANQQRRMSVVALIAWVLLALRASVGSTRELGAQPTHPDRLVQLATPSFGC